MFSQETTCGSPYFATASTTDAANLALAATNADVVIGGPIADVTITQEYINRGRTPIEAQYVFPASTRAAVYHMEMKIGERTITANIKEKNAARATYEKAKQEGKRTSLLEQHRPNVFQMNVANIMPGEKIIITLKYSEFLIPEEQVYSFVYPTVVGPRYTGAKPSSFAANPHLSSGLPEPYQVDISVDVNVPVPIKWVKSPTHKITQEEIQATRKKVRLDIAEKHPGNRDYILQFKLGGDEIMTGVSTYDNGEEKFFLCQIEPPKKSALPFIAPREYIFIIDVSGSMSGFPLDISKYLMQNLLGELRPTDKFNILFFAGSAFSLRPASIEATAANIKMALQEVDNQQGGGGTELLPAIKQAMAIPKAKGFSRSFVIATDGYVNVESEAFQYISKHLNKANFYAFGIGSGVNRHLIEGIAHVGRAEPFIVTSKEEAKDKALKLKNYIQFPVLTDIKITGKSVKLIDVVPEQVPDLMAERPIYFFGKYDDRFDAALTIEGQQGNTPFKRTVTLPEASDANKQLSYLWAREKLRYLSDFNVRKNNEKLKKEITRIGLKYNLLTEYTSFVAVDDRVVNDNLGLKTGRQILPLPSGVSNAAIGFEMEMEELTSTGSTTITVDVGAVSKNTEQLIDAILETIFINDLTKQEIASLLQSQLTLVYQAGQFVIQDAHSTSIEKRLVQLLNSKLNQIKYPIKSGDVISIGITH